MPTAALDHLVIAATSLAQGGDYIGEKLGVELQGGGRHDRQGTHNRLLKLDRGRYLEVIAIDPDGETPSFPRWFALDSREMQERLRDRPRLITWVARTDDIHALLASCSHDLGQVRAMSRGTLSWQMSFTRDGSLLQDGLVPPVIQWDTDRHPCDHLAESGCRLSRLEAFHAAPLAVSETLAEMGLDKEILLRPATPTTGTSLVAHIETATGTVILD